MSDALQAIERLRQDLIQAIQGLGYGGVQVDVLLDGPVEWEDALPRVYRGNGFVLSSTPGPAENPLQYDGRVAVITQETQNEAIKTYDVFVAP